MAFPTYGTTVSPSTGLRPATVVGDKARPSPPRPPSGDANGGTQSAEYPTVEGSGIPVEASSASGWEGPIDRAVRAVTHTVGHNSVATVDVPRESVLENRGNAQPEYPLRGILAL
jgi:hypothetical protein